MKGTQIILDTIAGREAAGLVTDGALDDLLIDGDTPRLGTIYRARVDRLIKGQGGVFMKGPDGNLYLRQAKGLSPGDTFLVQVSGNAEPGKATPVTSRLLFKSRYAIVTPEAPGVNVSRSIREDETRVAVRAAATAAIPEECAHGIILRSACADAIARGDPDAISEDVEAMLSLADQILQDTGNEPEKLLEGDGPHMLAWRDWPDVMPQKGGLSDWLQSAQSIHVSLDGPAHMYVEATRALVAVDVNTGGDTSPAAGFKANISAIRALPRALRLRGLAGQIVIDLAPMPKKDRKGLEAALRAALRSDGVETTLVGWTPLGHIELSRKRDRPALSEVLSEVPTEVLK